MDTLDLEDPKVYQLLRQGRTGGVFQFESPLATETLRNMKCDRFDDLVASNALLRPGPLDTGMHLVFIRRKLGQEAVSYPHPDLKTILEPTYGVITYQEQVMRIANVLAGFSLAEADVLRKAVGKKDAELIRKELGRFVERAVAMGHAKDWRRSWPARSKTFGRYGFNKSHSVAYSILCYQTAWLKTYYPAEFMAALLSSEIGSTDKVVQYINEARELGLEVLPPDVNESGFKFTVIGDQRLRFGLGAVRNVGRGRHRVDDPGANRSALQQPRRLRQAGRPPPVQQAGARVPHRRRRHGRTRRPPGPAHRGAGRGAARGAASPAGTGRRAGLAVRRGAAPNPRRRDRTARGAGLDRAGAAGPGEGSARLLHLRPSAGALPAEVEVFGTRTTATLGEWSEHQVTLAAVITQVKRQISKKTGKEYARLVLEDFHGTAEAIVFPDAWARLNQM